MLTCLIARSLAVATILVSTLGAPAFAREAGGGSAEKGQAVVKVTPLGSHDGEFCRSDRAILFEDPTGVRILWDPGQTTWAGDPRLGTVHAIVLSSVHGDHVGAAQPTGPNAGACGSPETTSAAPDTVTARIAQAKNAAVIAGGEMPAFIGRKIQVLRGPNANATAGCTAVGLTNDLTVPLTEACVAVLRPGGTRTVKLSGATAGVQVSTVLAVHSNGISGNLLEPPGVAPGTTGYGGQDTGAILTFTNGLTVYLSGDTGQFGDMDSIIRRYYRPQLAVLNMGDIFSMGPEEAAFATNELIKPRSVMPSHANEVATVKGAVQPDTRTEFFTELVKGAKVVVPLSGVTRHFNGSGVCVNCP